MLLNEMLARELWPNQDPIGRKLIFEAGVFAHVVVVVQNIIRTGWTPRRNRSSIFRHSRRGFTPVP